MLLSAGSHSGLMQGKDGTDGMESLGEVPVASQFIVPQAVRQDPLRAMQADDVSRIGIFSDPDNHKVGVGS